MAGAVNTMLVLVTEEGCRSNKYVKLELISSRAIYYLYGLTVEINNAVCGCTAEIATLNGDLLAALRVC
jgi:hypothetical protein